MLRLLRMLWGWFGNVGWFWLGILLNIFFWSSFFIIILMLELELIVLCFLDCGVIFNFLLMFFNILLLFVCEWVNFWVFVLLRFMLSLLKWFFIFLILCLIFWFIGVYFFGFLVLLKYLFYFSLWVILGVSIVFIK